MVYDVIIIGEGPAGMAAAIYAARKRLKTLILSDDIGGQLVKSGLVENWLGEKGIQGPDLVKKFQEHIFNLKVPVKKHGPVKKIKKKGKGFLVYCGKKIFQSKSVIIATGRKAKELGVPGEDEYKNKGVTYCATCDAPLFANKNVAVIGGGNSGLDAAIQLLPYAKKIHVLEFMDKMIGDQVFIDKLKNSGKVDLIVNAETIKIFGDKFVTGLEYSDRKTGAVNKIDVSGIFVQIGQIPNTEFIKDFIKLNSQGEIEINERNETSVAGIFAAGDVTSEPYKQLLVAAGGGVKAALSAYDWLVKQKMV